MQIKVEKGDITQIEADAIVNPANSYGYMGGGAAGAIKATGGEEIEHEAVSHAPIPIGHAVITTAGRLKAKKVIHSPTMEQPAQLATKEHIKEATIAALECADEHNIRKLAMPGMGTGVGGIPKDEAAKIIITAIKRFKPNHLQEIILIDMGDEMVKEFEKALSPSG